MKKILYIAEKPDIAKAIADFLGGFTKKQHCYIKEYVTISWCYGHLFKSADPSYYDKKWKQWSYDTLPIFPKKWTLLPSEAKHIASHIKELKKMLQDADEVIHCGDPDREGQLLVDELLRYFNFSGSVKRCLINAKDDLSMKRAFEQIEDNARYEPLYFSGLARSQLDWYLGMTGTRLYTLKAQHIGYQGKIIVGRVQTPTLALIVQREDDITNFVETNYVDISATILLNQQKLKATLQRDDYLTNQEEAKQIVQWLEANKKVALSKWDKKYKTESPPLPYSLDSLQGDCNKKYGWSPKQTLELTQSLYEKKFVTYPRSDCNFLPEAQHQDARQIISAIESGSSLPNTITPYCDYELRSKAWNDKKVTAHHAIIPTTVAPNKLSLEEQQLYNLIALRYIVQFYPVRQYEEVSYEFVADDYILNGKSIFEVNEGFTLAYKAAKALDTPDEEENNTYSSNSLVGKVGEVGSLVDVLSEQKKTKPPTRFTEGTLLTAMTNIYKFVSDQALKEKLKEIKGIGTPATRSTIIEGLLTNQFIAKKGKSLIPTEEGRYILSMLPSQLRLPDRTALMELKLSEIVNQTISYEKVIQEYQEELQQLVNEEKNVFISPSHAEQHGHSCPNCNHTLYKRKSKNGAFFWGCSNYPTCKTTFPDKNNKPFIVRCPHCDGYLVSKKGQKDLFWGCSNYPTCKSTFKNKNNEPVLE